MARSCFLVALFACSSAKLEPAPVMARGEPPQPLDAATADADPRAGYPARLVRPPATCTLRGTWREQPETLSLTPGGKPFASVFGVQEAEVTLGAGAFAEFTTATIDVAGFTDPKRLRLHAKAAFTLGGYAVPAAEVPLQFVGERDGQITVELPLPSFVTANAPPRGERPCGELAIDGRATFDPHAAHDAPTAEVAYLHAKRAIPLAVELGQPPVAELRYEQSPPRVRVIEKRAQSARVAIEISSLNPADRVVLVGWVPASALHAKASGHGGSWATGGDRSARREPRRKDARLVTCASETPLVVELDGERRTVGTIAPNVVIEVLAGDDDFVAVRIAKPDAELAEGARWLVKQAAIAGCAAVAAP